MIQLKTTEEIDGIRNSCHLLVSIFNEVLSIVSAGKTTLEINNYAEKLIGNYDAIPSFSTYGKFPAAMCISINDEVIHGVPSHKKIIKEGDIVSLDLGLVKDNFFSDMAKTIAVGFVSQEKRKLLENTERSLVTCINEINKAQNTIKYHIGDIGRIISKYLKPFNYGIIYDFCGHGVGLSLHEDPQIPHNYPSKITNQKIPLCKGMTLAIEPMVSIGRPEIIIDRNDGWTVRTLDRSLSAHFEHTVAIFDNYIEILTQ